MGEIIQRELSYKITGFCFKTQNKLGRFCRERQYADEFENVLKENNVEYEREFSLDKLDNNDIKGNIVDFLIEESVIVDFKAKKFTTKDDYYQMQRYLKSADLKLGLIVNFRETYLKPKRVINNEYDKNVRSIRVNS